MATVTDNVDWLNEARFLIPPSAIGGHLSLDTPSIFLDGCPRRLSIPCCAHESLVYSIYPLLLALGPSGTHLRRVQGGVSIQVSTKVKFGRLPLLRPHVQYFREGVLLRVAIARKIVLSRKCLVNGVGKSFWCDEAVRLVIEVDERVHFDIVKRRR